MMRSSSYSAREAVIGILAACAVCVLCSRAEATMPATPFATPRQAAGADDSFQVLRAMIVGIQVPPGDRCHHLVEQARASVLAELDAAQGKPFVVAGAASMIRSTQGFISYSHDYGEFTGQYLTDSLVRMVRAIQVRSAQCVSLTEAAAAATDLSSAVERVCTELEVREVVDTAALVAVLRRAADQLRERITTGDVAVARRSLDRAGIDAFYEHLRTVVAAKDPGMRPSPQLVWNAYDSAFQSDPCVEAVQRLHAAWAAANADMVNEFMALEQEYSGQRMLTYSTNRMRRLQETGAIALQEKVEAANAEHKTAFAEAARVSCLLAISAAAAESMRAISDRTLSWHTLECTIVWTPRDANGKWFIATYAVAAKMVDDQFEVRVGLARVRGAEEDLPLALEISGASLRMACGLDDACEIQGLLGSSCDEEWVRASFRAAVCGTEVGSAAASPRLYGLRAFRYPLLNHGFAYGGRVIRAAAIPYRGIAKNAEAVVSQSELLQCSRALASASHGAAGTNLSAALRVVGRTANDSSYTTQFLRAAVLRQVAAIDATAVPGGVAGAQMHLLDLLALPADSEFRRYIAQTPPETALAPPLVAGAAAMFWAVVDGRPESPREDPAIVPALVDACVAVGLSDEEARGTVMRAYRALHEQGLADSVLSDRWALSAVPLVTQAAGAASLRDAAARRVALDALEWMLLGAGDRMPVGGEERRGSWAAALAPLRQELEQLAGAGAIEAQEKTILQDLGERAIGGLRWRAGYPCFPPLNFDPTPEWVGTCIAQSIEAAQRDLERAVPGSAQRWPSELTRSERQLAIGLLIGRLYSALITDPDGPTAPQGHGAASLPVWAGSFALMIQDPVHPMLTIQRKP